VFFYLPLGAVVILLSRAIPVEGGTYQWRRSPGSWWPWRLCPFRLCPLPAWLTRPSLV
jgi:hypothetical protein